MKKSKLFEHMNFYHWITSVIILITIIGGGVTYANKIPFLEESVVALEEAQGDVEETVARMDERMKNIEEDLERLVEHILGDE